MCCGGRKVGWQHGSLSPSVVVPRPVRGGDGRERVIGVPGCTVVVVAGVVNIIMSLAGGHSRHCDCRRRPQQGGGDTDDIVALPVARQQ